MSILDFWMPFRDIGGETSQTETQMLTIISGMGWSGEAALKMKRNADWIAKGNAYRMCHSESRSTPRRADNRLIHVKCLEGSRSGSDVILGLSRYGIINNLQKTR